MEQYLLTGEYGRVVVAPTVGEYNLEKYRVSILFS